MTKSATLLLNDGTVFKGKLLGYHGLTVGEVVFNTAMTGYQEILTDPSYAKQIVCLTSSHIGNTGVNAIDQEAERIYAAGLIVRDVPQQASSWRSERDLEEWLIRHRLVALSDIDTRRLTRHLRSCGVKDGVIYADSVSEDAARAALKGFDGLQGMDLASVVTVDKKYRWQDARPQLHPDEQSSKDRLSADHHIVAYDFGIKRTILSMLVEQGGYVDVVPARTSAADVMAMKPDGVFLSNGPGDPDACDYAIEAVQELLDVKVPVFGICLGHQLLSLACGAKTVKMKFGHHGANHPVVDIADGKVMITSQNHGFCVDEKTLPAHLEATHRSLFDGSLQGVAHTGAPAFGFQGHPEASPGPHDIAPLFERFAQMINAHKN